MPNYIATARNTSPITEVPVTAESREHAIHEIMKTAKPGEQLEIMSVVEVSDEAAPKEKAHAADDKHARK